MGLPGIHPALCPQTCWPLATDQLFSSKNLPHPSASSVANTRTGGYHPESDPSSGKGGGQGSGLTSVSLPCIIHPRSETSLPQRTKGCCTCKLTSLQELSQLLKSCPALSSPSVSFSHVKTPQEHWLSVLVFLAIFLEIKEIVHSSKHSPRDYKLCR